MHALHPRSRSTSTLFTTTLAVSFLVVALPHLLPCPVDRRQFADSTEHVDGKVRKRKKRDGNGNAEPDSQLGNSRADDGSARKRECPVPKPGGLVGQIMGFEQTQKDKPVDVIVKSFRSRHHGPGNEDNNQSAK